MRQNATCDPTETAIRSTRGGSIRDSSGRSASTESISATSSTVVANGPFSATPNHEFGPRSAGTMPYPGLMPNSPRLAAGTLIEPMPSAPVGDRHRFPEATAAALPPEDPPGTRSVFHGFRVIAIGESVLPQMHNSGTAVIPTTIAPAARNLATTGWSFAAGLAEVAVEPLRSGSPATATLSLIATGTPASGSP